jgi:hypothetical protein
VIVMSSRRVVVRFSSIHAHEGWRPQALRDSSGDLPDGVLS